MPALAEMFHQPSLTEDLRAELGAVLACRQAIEGNRPAEKWQELSLSAVRAGNLMEQLTPELRAYPVWQESGIWQVRVEGLQRNCFGELRIN